MSLAVGGHQRQVHREDGSGIGRVGGADRAAVLLGHLADDRQPETGPLLTANVGAPVEAVEDVGQVLLVDPGTVVPDSDAGRVDVDLHRPVRW